MIYKYAEIQYRETLFKACRGILRTKVAELNFPGIYKEAADPTGMDTWIKGRDVANNMYVRLRSLGYSDEQARSYLNKAMRESDKGSAKIKAWRDDYNAFYDALDDEDREAYDFYGNLSDDEAYLNALEAREGRPAGGGETPPSGPTGPGGPKSKEALDFIKELRAAGELSGNPIFINSGEINGGVGGIGNRTNTNIIGNGAGGMTYDPRTGMWYEYDEDTGEMVPAEGGGTGYSGTIHRTPVGYYDDYGRRVDITDEEYERYKRAYETRERVRAEADEKRRIAEEKASGEEMVDTDDDGRPDTKRKDLKGTGTETTGTGTTGTGTGTGTETTGPDRKPKIVGPTGDPYGEYGKEYEVYDPKRLAEMRADYVKRTADRMERDRRSALGDTFGGLGGAALGGLGAWGGYAAGDAMARNLGWNEGGLGHNLLRYGLGALGAGVGAYAGGSMARRFGKSLTRDRHKYTADVTGKRVYGKSYRERQQEEAGKVFDDMIRRKATSELNTDIPDTHKDLRYDEDLYKRLMEGSPA